MFKHVTLVYHEAAGDGRLKKLLPDLTAMLNERTEAYETINLGDSGSTQSLTHALHMTDLLIIAGGDGTVHHVINQVYPSYRNVTCAILPAGTANDFARALNMPLDLTEVLAVILNGDVTPVDLGICDDYVFLIFFGVGLVTQTKERLDQTDDKDKLGQFGYYLNSLRVLKAPEGFTYRVTDNQETTSGEAVMIMISNGGFTGGVNVFFSDTQIDDGLFDVVIMEEANLQTLHDLFTMKREINAKDLTHVKAFKSNQLTIETTPARQIDCDGETKDHTPASITVKKHALTFCHLPLEK